MLNAEGAPEIVLTFWSCGSAWQSITLESVHPRWYLIIDKVSLDEGSVGGAIHLTVILVQDHMTVPMAMMQSMNACLSLVVLQNISATMAPWVEEQMWFDSAHREDLFLYVQCLCL